MKHTNESDQIAKASVAKASFNMVEHPPYSPNLGPSISKTKEKRREILTLGSDLIYEWFAQVDHFFSLKV